MDQDQTQDRLMNQNLEQLKAMISGMNLEEARIKDMNQNLERIMVTNMVYARPAQ